MLQEHEIIASWKRHLDQPLVSICCVTYNHESFINETLDSFLNQKTDFGFEIIVGEDCSTDKTLDILREYEKNYPNIVRLITSDTNVGGGENWCRTIDSARGEYIAYCDGDDYYMDSNKLSSAVDVFEQDKQVTFLFTPALQTYEDGRDSKVRNRYSKSIIDEIDLDWVLVKGGAFYPTSTIVFKSDVTRDRPFWFYKHCTGDYPLAILAIVKGKIAYLDDISAIYRVHSNSMTNSMHGDKELKKESIRNKYKRNIDFIDALKSEKIIAENMYRFLVAKEDYVYYAKLLDLGLYLESIKGIYKVRYLSRFKLRIIAKFIYKIILRNEVRRV